MTFASRSCWSVSPPFGLCGLNTTQSSSESPRSSTAVLRPRCWSGRNSTFSPWAKAHSSARLAFDDVQTVPPCRPVNDLIAAVEFMYVTGTVTSAMPAASSTVPAVLDLVDRGHVGHRAAGGEVGEDDLLLVAGEDVGALGHEVHAAEHDVRRLGVGRGLLRELERVAGDVGELDDLVALVVVAEDEHLVAERRLRGAGALDEAGVARGGQVAGALDAALAVRVGLAAEQQQGERGRLDALGELEVHGHGVRPRSDRRCSRVCGAVQHPATPRSSHSVVGGRLRACAC